MAIPLEQRLSTRAEPPKVRPSEPPKVRPSDVQVGGDHYKKLKIEPAEFCTVNKLGFLESCVIKRMCRWRAKNGIEDLRKAVHEIELLIEYEEKGHA